jgi:hypothetical protein
MRRGCCMPIPSALRLSSPPRGPETRQPAERPTRRGFSLVTGLRSRGELRLQHVQAIPRRIGPGAFGFPARLDPVGPDLHLAGSQFGNLCSLLGPIGAATFRGKVGRKGFDDGCIGLRALAGGRNRHLQDVDHTPHVRLDVRAVSTPDICLI